MSAVPGCIRLLPFLVCLLPVAGVVTAFLLSARAGHIAWCFPLVENCASISATGRQPPGSYWFKGLMIPGALCMLAFWWQAARWLRHMGDRARRLRLVMIASGGLAAAGLIHYTLMLGSIGPEYELQRRVGVISYFGLCSLAQILLTVRLHYLHRAIPVWVYRGKLVICIFILVLGWANVVLSAAYAGFERLDDILEWNFALLNMAYFPFSGFLWRATGFPPGAGVCR